MTSEVEFLTLTFYERLVIERYPGSDGDPVATRLATIWRQIGFFTARLDKDPGDSFANGMFEKHVKLAKDHEAILSAAYPLNRVSDDVSFGSIRRQ